MFLNYSDFLLRLKKTKHLYTSIFKILSVQTGIQNVFQVLKCIANTSSNVWQVGGNKVYINDQIPEKNILSVHDELNLFNYTQTHTQEIFCIIVSNNNLLRLSQDRS